MKFFSFFFLFFLFLLISSSIVSSIGISPPRQYVNFDAGNRLTLDFKILNYGGTPNSVVNVALQGSPLDKYISFSKNNFSLSKNENSFQVFIDFPSYEDMTVYGSQRVYFLVSEVNMDSSSTFSVVTAVKPSVFIQIPVPGHFAKVSSLDVANVLENHDSPVSFTIENQGTESLKNTRAELVVSDLSGSRMDRLLFSNINIAVGDSLDLSNKILSSTYPPGKYKATLNYYFDDELQPASKSLDFFVGTTDVLVLNYTSDLMEGKINKVSFTLQSLWSDDLKSIRASINDFNNHLQPMPVIDLAPFEKRVVESYIDVPFLNASPFFLNTSIINETSVDTFMTLEFPVGSSSDVNKNLSLSFNIHKTPEPVVVKKSFHISTTALLISGMILIILILIILLINLIPKKKMKKTESIKKVDLKK